MIIDKEKTNLEANLTPDSTTNANTVKNNSNLDLEKVVRQEQEFKKKELVKRKILWRKSNWKRGSSKEYEYKLINVQRVIKVTKGGRRFSFLAVALAGNKKGKVGFGTGKGTEVVLARKKAFAQAEKNMLELSFVANTIPHTVIGKFCSAKILLKPAAKGTGIIAGGAARLVLELLGINNIRGKSLGSNNKANLIRATFAALKQLRTLEEVQKLRGIIK